MFAFLLIGLLILALFHIRSISKALGWTIIILFFLGLAHT